MDRPQSRSFILLRSPLCIYPGNTLCVRPRQPIGCRRASQYFLRLHLSAPSRSSASRSYRGPIGPVSVIWRILPSLRLTIVAIFLVWHLANHVLAVWSLDTNKQAMELLRAWYRADLVQPVLIALLGWQLVTGLRLLWAKVARAGDVYSSIQTATAVYLLVYIPSHLIAVFIWVDGSWVWTLHSHGRLALQAGFCSMRGMCDLFRTIRWRSSL